MQPNELFKQCIIDAMPEHVAVLDGRGQIVFTNQTWDRFGVQNACTQVGTWEGVNYLTICDVSAEMGDEHGRMAAQGIRSVMQGAESFHFEYPCHSPTEKRWFMMTTSAFVVDDERYYLVTHADITQRKLAEEYALSLSQHDGLTGLFNRRHFDDFMNDEWSRCARLGLPISLVMIDIDEFKILNDTYGHQVGDHCLRKVGELLMKYPKRPSDLCARYGGEEFAMVFGNSKTENVIPLLEELKRDVENINIENRNAQFSKKVTLSMGVATEYPKPHTSHNVLIYRADSLLYEAKHKGRNRIEGVNDAL